MKVALICIAKNEDNYIDEWLKYHKKIGFDKIFIYENNWRCPPNINYDFVEKTEFDGEIQQIPAYNHFIYYKSHDFDWVCFLDVDEFIVLKQHSNIKDFLNNYNHLKCIALNWLFFGNDDLKFNGEYSLIKRFTKRQAELNKHIKCIFKPSKKIGMNIHQPNMSWVDMENNEGTGPFSSCKNDSVAFVAHFFCKTPEEFNEKINRGRADMNRPRSLEDYTEGNNNIVEDLSVYNFMYGN